MLLLEFTIEPFLEGRPGPHVTGAIAAVEALGIEVEFGPFGSSCTVGQAQLAEVSGAILAQAFANGATHVSLHAERVARHHGHRMSKLPRHPLVLAVKPIIEQLGASLVAADEREPGDLPLKWEGVVIAAVRPAPLHGALDRLIESVEREMGSPLPGLSREEKQKAIRLLDDRGAFILRRAVEDVADAMGVSRITVYNYLNALHR